MTAPVWAGSQNRGQEQDTFYSGDQMARVESEREGLEWAPASSARQSPDQNRRRSTPTPTRCDLRTSARLVAPSVWQCPPRSSVPVPLTGTFFRRTRRVSLRTGLPRRSNLAHKEPVGCHPLPCLCACTATWSTGIAAAPARPSAAFPPQPDPRLLPLVASTTCRSPPLSTLPRATRRRWRR